jgi:ribonuclease HI
MLRKILGAFKTSPTAAMEIEAAILPVRNRFEKIFQNYAFRAIQLDRDHPIKQRTPESFPNSGNNIDIELDWDKYLDWNQTDQSRKKKHPSQLYRVLNSVSTSILSLNIEESGFKTQAPWLINPIDLDPITKDDSNKDKIGLAQEHSQLLQDIQLKPSIIGYTDGSKIDNLDAGASLYLIDRTKSPEVRKEHSWYLGASIEVYDAELLAISKAIKHSLDIVKQKDIAKNIYIYIFTDSQAAIDRIKKHLDIGPGYSIVRECIQLANRIAKLGARIAIRWIPGHANILGNEIADQLAKRAARTPQLNPYIKVSLTNIRRKLNKSLIDNWQKDWEENTAKGKHYSQFKPYIKRKAIKPTTNRRTWTAYIQLKLGHGYFRSYLSRIRQDSDRCIGQCQGIQSPIHLYLSCQHYKEEQKALISKLKDLFPRQPITLAEIYTEKSRQVVYDYLKKTRIATREWLLELEAAEATD